MERVLKYPGSKWNIAEKLVSLIPEHHSYVEPYFGSGAVLFNKQPSNIETINDLNHDVVNLFRCIQQDTERLAAMVMTTPYSRENYEDTYKQDMHEYMASDECHKALTFLIRCWQGHGFRADGSKTGWKNDIQGREKAYALWDWYRLPDRIVKVAERMRQVQIENSPALDVIKRFNYDNVFMYVDPPYLLSKRSGRQYMHEMSDSDHEILLRQLLKSNAKIMVSGYESDMYNDYLSCWKKICFVSCAEGGTPRKEYVWMNYDTVHQMSIEDFPEVLP